MAVQAFGGFGDDFDEALADDRPIGGGSKVFQDRAPELGEIVKFGKKGTFDAKVKNKKNQLIDKPTKVLVGVLVDSYFGKQDWGGDGSSGGMKCGTTAHTLKTKANPEGEAKKTGWWKLPYFGNTLVERYSPVGSKPDPENEGKPMSCGDCIARGLNKNCQDKGSLLFIVTGYHDADEGEIVNLEPYGITLQTPKTTGIAFQKYVQKTLPEMGYRVSKVLTRLTLEEEVFTVNGKDYNTNLIAFSAEGELTDEQVGMAQRLYNEGMETWKKNQEEARKKRAADKAKAGGGKAAGGAKGKTDDDAPPFSLEDDEVAY